ncbi:hypothetical protein IVG45_21155 [Methylomonas sp. LL1]|uniref:hypothetical protein n=1 Tax=Methylomonas sp. LL1 TaxID=2785785 RepID=UPI0018C36BEF|nr:hypothetical protein [Methylomonas sp. LL1]QPK63280.1 hypothetical protein IVG45_21155 [Methylomonas sp. LL1]
MKLSPREKRVINALSNHPIMRENLDTIAGCSNGPELVAGLRRKGLSVPCDRVERYDKDGNACYPGLYSFTAEDKQVVRDWMKGAQ